MSDDQRDARPQDPDQPIRVALDVLLPVESTAAASWVHDPQKKALLEVVARIELVRDVLRNGRTDTIDIDGLLANAREAVLAVSRTL